MLILLTLDLLLYEVLDRISHTFWYSMWNLFYRLQEKWDQHLKASELNDSQSQTLKVEQKNEQSVWFWKMSSKLWIIIEILIFLHLISKSEESLIWFCWHFQNFFIEFQKMNSEHASTQRSNFNDETSLSAINIIWKNWVKVSSTTKKSLKRNEINSIKIKNQKFF